MLFKAPLALFSLLAASSSSPALALPSSPSSSAPITTELHGRKLPPLTPGILAELQKRSPEDYQVFHNDLHYVRAVQQSGASGQQESAELQRRQAALTGNIKRCTTSRCFAITFDDGPYIYHQDLARTVNAAGFKATFFVNGYNFDCIYDAPQVQSVRRSLKMGHQIASHTWGHVSLVGLTYAQIDRQIELLETALLKIAGVVPAVIRPPYGNTNDTINKYLNEKHGLTVVTWNYDLFDADGGTPSQSLDILRGIKAPTHAIVLEHETVEATNKTIVPQQMGIMKSNGYAAPGVNTVAAVLGINPYKVQTNYGARDASWTCDGKLLPGQPGAP